MVKLGSQLIDSGGNVGAKGFSKIEPKNVRKKNTLDTQSADQVEGGNEELFNTGRLL